MRGVTQLDLAFLDTHFDAGTLFVTPLNAETRAPIDDDDLVHGHREKPRWVVTNFEVGAPRLEEHGHVA